MTMPNDPIQAEEGDGQELPVLVLPASGATYTQGLGVGFGAVTAGSLAPQPIMESSGGSGFDNLASRIEQILSEDGRFASLAENLVVAADEEGHVILSGPVPDPLIKRSLLATLHAVPGVADVIDDTH